MLFWLCAVRAQCTCLYMRASCVFACVMYMCNPLPFDHSLLVMLDDFLHHCLPMCLPCHEMARCERSVMEHPDVHTRVY